MYSSPNNRMKSSSSSSSITELLGALCDSSLSGVSWKRRALGGVSRDGFRRALKKCAYGALLSKLFQDDTKGSASGAPSATANTPAKNKILMISFDLRVAGCREEAERLEEKLGMLMEGESSGLKEVDAVLELLVHLAGSAPPPPTSFSRDYMRRERPVLRRPPPWSYQSEELQRLEARAWGLVCGEEWRNLESLCGNQRLMDAPPGTGLLALRTKLEVEERFERETRMTLFGALQHTRTSDIDIRLDLPPVPSNIDVTGLALKIPTCLDQSEDEGFQSASNMTPDSQSETSPVPDVDIWEALRTFEPGRRRCWESAQLVFDLLNVLIGVASITFPLNQSVQFDVRPGVCVSGASPESVSRLLGELAHYGTHYLRLSRFSLQSADKKGLVFQAFTGGLRKYLHYYRACVLSTPPTLSLLTISFLFRKVGRQLRYLSELCCVDGPLGAGQATFPVVSALLSANCNMSSITAGVKLMSYLYNEAQNNCSNENYPVLLFVSDWVYSGVFRDVYGEFMIQVNEEYLGCRDKHFWVQGYTLISKDVEDCVPVFLRHIGNDVYVCGKTINLLKICCPQHYICWSELPVPRIAVTFSLQEVEVIERDCAVYRGRMERLLSTAPSAGRSSGAGAPGADQSGQRVGSQNPGEHPRCHNVWLRKPRRERFDELKQHLEQEQEVWRNVAVKRQQGDDFSFARELRDREQRLQALEEQLEQRARKELIAQYSRLSEEAARRERRAMWRAQRLRLDEARSQFVMRDRQQIQAILEKYPLGQERPPMEVFQAVPSVQQTAPQPALESPTQDPPEQQPAETQESHAASPPPDPSSATPPTADPALISENIDINDFLPKSSNASSEQVDSALQEIGSELPEVCPTAQLVDYDFSAPFSITGQASVQPRPRWGPAGQPDMIQNHPSFSHIPIGENISQVQDGVPRASPFGQASKSSFPLGQYTPEEPQTSTSTASIYGHPSQASVQLVDGSGSMTDNKQAEVASMSEQKTETGSLESKLEGNKENAKSVDDYVFDALPTYKPELSGKAETSLSGCGRIVLPDGSAQNKADNISMPNTQVSGEPVSDAVAQQPSLNTHGHSSDSHIQIEQLVSEVAAPLPSHNVHGHASDSHMKIGEHASEVEAPLPSHSVHGHSSDAHIKVGENVSDFVAAFPSPNVHGHASDDHFIVGENVSDVDAPLPSPNVHGHSSDAHIKVGENISDFVAPLPVHSIHGHSSDANIKVGEFVSNVTEATPRSSQHGHVSDGILRPGCVVSGDKATSPSLPGSTFGHSSDSGLGAGCVVSGDEAKRFPIPGSAHGHASDSHIASGCVVSKTEPVPSLVPGSAYGHSSDSTLGGGCAVLGKELQPSVLPGSTYGHSSDSSLAVGCVVKGDGILNQQKTEDNEDGFTESWAAGFGLSPGEKSEQEYLLALCAQYEVEQYEDCYNLMASSPECQLLKQVTRGPWGFPMDPTLCKATDTTAVQLSELVSLPVLIKTGRHHAAHHTAVVDYFFVELGVERHFEALRHFLLMEDGEFAQSLSDLLFEKALQYSLHGDTPLAGNFTFALRFLPETFHPHAPDSLNCLELRYKVDWPLNIIITDSCMNKYNRLFSFVLQLKHMVWSLREVWFHLKRTALVKGAGRSVQFHQLQLYRHEMQHFVKVIQGYITNQILQVSWMEFTAKLATANDLDAIHRTHADYLNRAIFRGLLTEKAAPVMNIIHSIFSLILKFRAQLIAQPWGSQQGEAVHPSFIAMQQSYNTFKTSCCASTSTTTTKTPELCSGRVNQHLKKNTANILFFKASEDPPKRIYIRQQDEKWLTVAT
ncbi:hypothetical protein F7725_023141 [Dissostichus mawsoni]|uniref:Gamma-tubulin complex component 6 n=1 Tax=Dissostichus mawsoni TaxID=36200 RepID=A0A7J5Z098_DISMA|nr:hypothetical protein F7725_023141 [Dissostichus mawsoni]